MTFYTRDQQQQKVALCTCLCFFSLSCFLMTAVFSSFPRLNPVPGPGLPGLKVAQRGLNHSI